MTINPKMALATAAFVLLSIIILALASLSAPGQLAPIILAFAAGISMIFLPCTLPLAFIIVPLSMGRGYKKGILIALAFGLGLTITITSYGIAIALLGQFFGVDQATQVMWFVAGVAAYAFGISELKILKLEIPALMMKTPKFIENSGDYIKSFFMGLFLGNAGVGCPNPAFYILLGYIASVGSIFEGGLLGAIHGIGRAIPLLFLAILGIIGINATKSLIAKRIQVERAMGWALILVGAFILMLGIFGHGFWERSPLHSAWNEFATDIGLSSEINAGAHDIIILPWTLIALLTAIPIAWIYAKKKWKPEHHKAIAILAALAILTIIGYGIVMQSISPEIEMHGEAKEFNVTAFQWGFEPQIIRVDKGDVVILHVTSTDVVHGMASTEFGFDETIKPGEITNITFVADKPGVFRFYCSMVCGIGHSDQKGFLVIEDPENPFITEPIKSEKTTIKPTIDGKIDNIWESTKETSLKTIFMGDEKEIRIKSLNNGENIYFLLRWKDNDQNDDGTTPTDRIAVEFDISGGSEIGMGAAGVPHVKEEQKTIGTGIVDIWHWKAFDSHTNKTNTIDDEFAGPFPELAAHYYRDDDNKYGGNNDLSANGIYNQANSEWIVEIARSLVTQDSNISGFGDLDKQLSSGNEYPIAFAIWDGGKNQEGGEHQTTDWATITIEQ